LHSALPGTDALIGAVALAIATVVFIRRAVDPGLRTMPEAFVRHYAAARWLLWGRDFRNVYQGESFGERVRRFGLREPSEGFAGEAPTAALLLAPLAWLSPETARRLWTVANVAAYLIGVHVLLGVLGADEFLARCLLWSLALVWSPTHEAFRRGEASVLIFALHVMALMHITEGHLWLAGGYLGLALLVKPYSLPLLPVVAFRGQLQALYGALAALVGLTAVTLPLTGLGSWAQYVGHQAPAALSAGFLPGPQYQGLGSAIGNAFSYDPVLSPHPWVASPVLAVGLQSLLTVFVLVVGLGVAARRRPQLSDPMAFGTATVAALIASPRAQEPHFAMALMPTLALLARYLGGVGTPWISWTLIASAALLAAPLGPSLPVEHRRGLAKLTQYPRLLGCIGILVMCILAPMFKPEVWG
jgi:hypothetical protein